MKGGKLAVPWAGTRALEGIIPQAIKEMIHNDSIVEDPALAWLAELGYARAYRPQLAFLIHNLTHNLTYT